MSAINQKINVAGKKIGAGEPVYFIADIAANHDGDLERAKKLIYLAKEAGADAAKFQHFKAETIVSNDGFQSMKTGKSHQATWGKSVFEIYKEASLNLDWTPILKEYCDEVGITFLTSPYDFELVDHVDPYVPAYKIGSGDITWIEMIEYISSKGKPIILATGASTIEDVICAVDASISRNPNIVLMQCNTNYTASLENFKYIELNVLKTYREIYPEIILGLSDHTPGHATVLGAVALGAKAIEKHFTDDVNRVGPDHKFSMDPKTWRDMVNRTRELELSLGLGIKKVEENEVDTVILQRRSLRLTRDLQAGDSIKDFDLVALRPCPADGLSPAHKSTIIGMSLCQSMKQGEYLKWTDLI